jgi:hypothetical protein
MHQARQSILHSAWYNIQFLPSLPTQSLLRSNALLIF